MSKAKKLGIGIIILLVLGVIGSFIPDDKNSDTVAKETSNQKTKESTMSKEDLVNNLDMYESLYSNHLENISKVASNDDPIELKKTFIESKDKANVAKSKIFDIKQEFDSSSNEFKALNELSTAFNSLESAYSNGIKYLDKNESKYFEKYEDDLKQSDLFLQRYMEEKSKL